MGMGEQIQSLAFSPDEKRLAVGVAQTSAVEPSGLYIWDVERVRLGAKMLTKTAPRVVEFSPNGQFVVTDNGDIEYLLFDAILQPEELDQPAEAFADGSLSKLSKPGNTLVVASGATVAQYAMPQGRLLRTLEFDDEVVLLDIANNERQFVVGTKDGVLTTWNVRNGSKTREINLKSQWNQSLNPVFSASDAIATAPDNRQVIVASSWGSLLWNVATGEEKLNFLGKADEFHHVAISEDGKLLATWGMTISTGQTHLRIWDFARGEMLHEFTEEAKDVHALAFSPQEAMLVCGGTGRLLVWKPDTPKVLTRIDIHQPGKSVGGLAFFPSGKQLAFSISEKIHLWDLEVGESLLLLSPNVKLRSSVHSMSIAPDGRHVIASYKRGSTFIWDLQTGGRRIVGKGNEK
jgi:WD40 repeat protein